MNLQALIPVIRHDGIDPYISEVAIPPCPICGSWIHENADVIVLVRGDKVCLAHHDCDEDFDED